MLKGVAVKHGDMVVGLPEPNRHHDVIRYIVDVMGITPPIGHDGQGFYTEEGKYLTRTEAYEYALKSGIRIKGRCTGVLYSENLW